VSRALLAALAVFVGAAPSVAAQSMRNFTAERRVSPGQPPLRATLEFGAGRVVVRAGDGPDLYKMRVRYDADRFAPIQEYDHRTGILHLGLRSIGRGGIRVTSRDQLDQVARFEFAPDVPLILAASLGASEAVLDLGGLTLVELGIRTGATRGTVDFSTPTLGACREAVFTVGATELVALNLANASCALVRVEGGIGRAVLDFGGTWRGDSRVVTNLAMGTLTLRIPRGTGVQLRGQRFLTKLNIDGLDPDDDGWSTPDFLRAERKLSIELETTLAGIDVEWVD
jgi:hypothetical protein